MLISNISIRCVWISLLFSSEIVSGTNAFENPTRQSLQDFPTYEDLRVYLTSLERIINFSHNYPEEIPDADYSFGFHFTKVNLKPYTTDDAVPKTLRYYLKSLLERNDLIINAFDKKSKQSITKYLSATWRGPKKLNFVLPRKRRFQSNQSEMYPHWHIYSNSVRDFSNISPNPYESDYCLTSMVNYTIAKSFSRHKKQKCEIPELCHRMLINGTNFGYALTHRLFYLMLANFGCGCTVLSTTLDQTMRHIFCNIMHTEAEFIAYNDFQETDLIFEQVSLCSLNGHAEFLRHSWLSNLLQYQSPHGCFRIDEQEDDRVVLWKLRNNLMNKTCSAHITTLACAALSAAVRFILEQY